MAGTALNRRDPAIPITMPKTLPSADRMKPSMTSAPMIRSLDQPMADRMPISRVRSSTAMSSVFSTMSTPMSNATQAMEVDTALKSPIRLSFCRTLSLLVTDSSNFRYAQYHCRNGDDVPSLLSFEFLTDVTRASVAAHLDVLGLK